MRTGLWEAVHINICSLIVEGDSLYAIRWASGSCEPRWGLTDVVEDIWDIGMHTSVSFSHIKRDTNPLSDAMAKEGVGRQSLLILTRRDIFS